MPWRSAVPPPCHGRIRFGKRKGKSEKAPLGRAAPNWMFPPPALDKGNISDVCMINGSLAQCDLDIIVEEEREEDMETDVPAGSMAPTPLKKS